VTGFSCHHFAIWHRGEIGWKPDFVFCGLSSLKLKIALLLPLILFVLPAIADAAGYREIHVKTVLKGGVYHVLAEDGQPNGMPCEWYAYATSVGEDYCDHPGEDVDANFENLYAATDGVVEFAGPDAAYWPNHVDIRVSDGKFKGELHIYGHMSQVFVTTGQAVKKGDPIGVSGTAGGVPHLHFERRTPPNGNCPLGCAIDPDPPLTGHPRTAS
jgi:hypothetical protein